MQHTSPQLKPIDPKLGWNTYRAILGHEPTVDPHAQVELPDPPRHVTIRLPHVHVPAELKHWLGRVGREALRRLDEARDRMNKRAA